MRLSEMYYMIRTVLDNWIEPTFKEEKQMAGLPTVYVRNGMKDICDLLDPIKELPDVSECLSTIKAISKSAVDGISFCVDSSGFSKITSHLSRLKIQLEAMCSMCETLGIDHDSDGFDVKLPPDIELCDAAACMSDLDTVFSQCPILPNDSKVKFSGVDIGSTWFMFIVIGTGTAAALRVIAELVDKVIAIRSHRLSYRQDEENLRTLELSNEILESVASAHKKALEKMTENIVQELSLEYGVNDPEEQERLNMSIDRLGRWIDRGMEIHAGVNAPKEVKLLFPPIEQQSLPKEITKALGETSKGE